MDGKLLLQVFAWTFFVIAFVFFGLGSQFALIIFLISPIVFGPTVVVLFCLGVTFDSPAASKNFVVWDTVLIVVLLISTFISVRIFGSHIIPNNTLDSAVVATNNAYIRSFAPYLLICPLIAYLLAISLSKKSQGIGFLLLILSFCSIRLAAIAGFSQHLGW